MKKEWTIYFELFGKKMRTTVMAESELKAKEILFTKIIFHKIEKKDSAFNKITDEAEDIFNMLNPNK